jgi:hypothetical protein
MPECKKCKTTVTWIDGHMLHKDNCERKDDGEPTEKEIVETIVKMATPSLDPDSYTALLDIMTRLAKTRNIDWKPF